MAINDGKVDSNKEEISWPQKRHKKSQQFPVFIFCL